MMALPVEQTNLASFIFFIQVTSSLLAAESSQQTVRGHLKEFFAAVAVYCPVMKVLRMPQNVPVPPPERRQSPLQN